ncbi:hypothetical protein F5X71_34595 [Nocardia brasiliensis]|uniref:Tail assembly chaperone n=1 Tax=Nocardia brasiliensis TaxID=37326 RepID=A0A6G9Y0W0_NOCBR|nr:hypothetical protein [Nocardia brasiliensis]QIS06756.1 hypothetical protein F5X71_34595 [Nocardia brasiliensis]
MATRNIRKTPVSAVRQPKAPLTAKKLSIAEFEGQALDALGQLPGYTLILDGDGGELNIPHPLLVADERMEEIERVQAGLDLDQEDLVDPETGKTITVPATPATIDGEPADSHTVRLARAVLGPEDHARLLAHGGKSAHVALAWQALAAEVQAASPKR